MARSAMPRGCSRCGVSWTQLASTSCFRPSSPSSPGRWAWSRSVTCRWCVRSGFDGNRRGWSGRRLDRRTLAVCKASCRAAGTSGPAPPNRPWTRSRNRSRKALQGADSRSAKPLENVNFWKNGRSGRIRTCDPCVPNVNSARKVQQKQWKLLAIDHLCRLLFTAFRWSIGGRPFLCSADELRSEERGSLFDLCVP